MRHTCRFLDGFNQPASVTASVSAVVVAVAMTVVVVAVATSAAKRKVMASRIVESAQEHASTVAVETI